MRRVAGAIVLCLLALPASAQGWALRKYPEAGFAIESPVALVRGSGMYKAAIAGPLQTVTYTGMSDGLKLSVAIIDISKRLPESVNLFEEAEYLLSLDGKVIANEGLGIEPGAQRLYGRELIIDKPDGSRTVTSIMYNAGKIYLSEALIPKDGDRTAYAPQRFVESIVFALDGPLRDRDSTRE